MLQIQVEIEEDANGVMNGVDCAGELLSRVCHLLGPYVKNCPGCVDLLFSALANRALAQFHHEIATGQYETGFVTVRETENPDTDARLIAHFEAFKPLVVSLLQGAGESHAH